MILQQSLVLESATSASPSYGLNCSLSKNLPVGSATLQCEGIPGFVVNASVCLPNRLKAELTRGLISYMSDPTIHAGVMQDRAVFSRWYKTS